MHLVPPDHFRERESQLRRAHRTAKRHKHFSAARQVRDVSLRSIRDDRRVEVPVMMPDKSLTPMCAFLSEPFDGAPALPKSYSRRACDSRADRDYFYDGSREQPGEIFVDAQNEKISPLFAS